MHILVWIATCKSKLCDNFLMIYFFLIDDTTKRTSNNVALYFYTKSKSLVKGIMWKPIISRNGLNILCNNFSFQPITIVADSDISFSFFI